MGFKLEAFGSIGLDEALLRALIERHERESAAAFDLFWSYYRNEMTAHRSVSAGGVVTARRLAQEAGLPARLRGRKNAQGDDRASAARERVIENDIAWRIHAMVDFMFGRPVRIRSMAERDDRREEIERVLDAVFEASGGISLLQDMGLLGNVHGHVDLLVRADGLFAKAARGRGESSAGRAAELAPLVRVELIEAPRAIPLLSAGDFRQIEAMVVRFVRESRSARAEGSLDLSGRHWTHSRDVEEVIEIHSAAHRQLYVNEELVGEIANPLDELPIAHVQNIHQPFRYEGLSEVEPLIPLQNELNTRLSDRANRVTLQSFKMYLAKGLEGVGVAGGAAAVIGPGQVWCTDNADASIEAFGGDGASPSEESHIEEIRQAMDKASAVTPLAAGVLPARIGQLSSANALRITLMGLLSKTSRKQISYGRGLAEVSRLILKAMDGAGVFRTSPEERRVRVEWPDPLPQMEQERLDAAVTKRELGVPGERVLDDLGLAPTADVGVS